jgi:hypothetical protein
MKIRACLVVFSMLAISLAPAPAWWVKGHGLIAEAAASRLPDDMPAFFRAAGKQLNYLAGEPDRWKNPEAKYLRAGESPNHYIDLEDYEDKELPADRYKAFALLQKLHRSPEKAGVLPYALLENFERLSVAFRDFREVCDKEKKAKDEGNDAALKALEPVRQAIESKCIVYAGALAHYTGDASMPLHTTRDYDGRKGRDGNLVQKGIHAKIDGFPETHGYTAQEISVGVNPKELEDVWQHVLKTIKESYTHIDRCYTIDKDGGFEKPTAEVREFIMQRCQVGAQFTADMLYTAWKRSEKLPASY